MKEGKKGKGVKIEKKRKIVKGKVENCKWESYKKRCGLFFLFFFCFSLLKTTKICFGSTKMGIFYREKAPFTPGKKSGKMTLPPQKNKPFMPLPQCTNACSSSHHSGKCCCDIKWHVQVAHATAIPSGIISHSVLYTSTFSISWNILCWVKTNMNLNLNQRIFFISLLSHIFFKSEVRIIIK